MAQLGKPRKQLDLKLTGLSLHMQYYDKWPNYMTLLINIVFSYEMFYTVIQKGIEFEARNIQTISNRNPEINAPDAAG